MRRAVTSSARPLAVTVTATEFKLAPAPLRVEAGRPVRLTFVNKGVAIHYMIVDHSLSRALQGGVAAIHVTGAANPAIFKPAPGDHIMQSMKH